jgi:SPP1 Gp6-like portal protein
MFLLNSPAMFGPNDQAGAVGRVKDMWPDYLAQRELVRMAETWTDIERAGRDLPVASGLNDNGEVLRRKAVAPWLGLAVTIVSQSLYVEGHRDEGSQENSSTWNTIWQPNRMDARQLAIHRHAVRDGLSYLTVLPGTNQLTGEPMVALTGHSAKSFYAGYEDSANDEWPIYAMKVKPRRAQDGSTEWEVTLYDDEMAVPMVFDGSNEAKVGTPEPHPAGVCPVVRFTNILDLEGNTKGEVLPYISLAARLDQTTFDRLMVQKEGAHRVRWATGLMKPPTEAEQRVEAQLLKMNDVLVNESPDGRFGTFDPTDMKGYIDAHDSDLRDAAANLQMPPDYFLGRMSNLSPEALAAAEGMLKRKNLERKANLGESWEQGLRLGAFILGDMAAATSFSSQVRWRDEELRSLNQVADALGKLATMVGLPWQMLVERIPGWTEADTQIAGELIEQQKAEAMAEAELQAALDQAAQASPGSTA